MNRKPGLDPMNLALMVAMVVIYGAIFWLWIAPAQEWPGVMP